MNELLIHDDVPFFWDNWDIMHHAYETKSKEVQKFLTGFKVTMDTDSQVILTFDFKISDVSKLSQDIMFYADSPRIDFKTHVDWFESRKLLKAYFPVNVRTDHATFDNSSGLNVRPIHANTSWDMARLEVCGHKFADLSDNRYGVAVLNDCKYGYTVRDTTIGISLLKAPEFPYEKTDKKSHDFIYSLLIHDKPLAQSNVFEEAYKLNYPLWAVVVEKGEKALESPSTFLDVNSENCQVQCFKRSEKDANKFVLRLAEVRGDSSMAVIKMNGPLKKFTKVELCNGLEEKIPFTEEDLHFKASENEIKLMMKPFKIVSVLLS